MPINARFAENLDELDSPKLQKAIALFADRLEDEAGKANTAEEQEKFFSELFDTQEGIFWSLYPRFWPKPAELRGLITESVSSSGPQPRDFSNLEVCQTIRADIFIPYSATWRR